MIPNIIFGAYLIYVSPNVWADQKSCQGDKLVINWEITAIKQASCMKGHFNLIHVLSLR